jgi:hypothetical protein
LAKVVKKTKLTKVKVKYPLVQALKLCTGRTAHMGSRGIAQPFHYHGTRRGEFHDHGTRRGEFHDHGTRRGEFHDHGTRRVEFHDHGIRRGEFHDHGTKRG